MGGREGRGVNVCVCVGGGGGEKKCVEGGTIMQMVSGLFIMPIFPACAAI